MKDFIFLNTLTKKTFVIKCIVFNFEKKFNKKKFNTVLLGILAKTINLYKPNNLKNIMINFIQNILKENNNRLFNELKLTLDKKLLLISTHVLLSLNKLNKEEKNIDEMIFLQVRRFLKDLFFSIIFNSYYLIKYSQKIFLKLWRISFSSVLILN